MPAVRPPSIRTERLVLEALGPHHAEELFPILDDIRLHEFIGGRPLSVEELRARYERLTSGVSPSGQERWLNWIVRRRGDGAAVGTVQATVANAPGGATALVAWVIGVGAQGGGFASEAARGLVRWLEAEGVREVRALIHPSHIASEKVAARAGLSPTSDFENGERVWRKECC